MTKPISQQLTWRNFTGRGRSGLIKRGHLQEDKEVASENKAIKQISKRILSPS